MSHMHAICVGTSTRNRPRGCTLASRKSASTASTSANNRTQWRAETFFQPFDGVGDGGARQAQIVGGSGETAEFDDPCEQAHGFETVHGIVSLDEIVMLIIEYLSRLRLCRK